MSEQKRFMVFNIGCIECGVSSAVVGLYATKEEAERVAAVCDDKLDWREGGQNRFDVFDLAAPQAAEYTEALGGLKDPTPTPEGLADAGEQDTAKR